MHINNGLGLGTANDIQCSDDSRSFRKEMRTLKMRRIVAGHQKLITTN